MPCSEVESLRDGKFPRSTCDFERGQFTFLDEAGIEEEGIEEEEAHLLSPGRAVVLIELGHHPDRL